MPRPSPRITPRRVGVLAARTLGTSIALVAASAATAHAHDGGEHDAPEPTDGWSSPAPADVPGTDAVDDGSGVHDGGGVHHGGDGDGHPQESTAPEQSRAEAEAEPGHSEHVEPEPIQPAPEESEPAHSASADPVPSDPEAVHSDSADTEPAESTPDESTPAEATPAEASHDESSPATSTQLDHSSDSAPASAHDGGREDAALAHHDPAPSGHADGSGRTPPEESVDVEGGEVHPGTATDTDIDTDTDTDTDTDEDEVEIEAATAPDPGSIVETSHSDPSLADPTVGDITDHGRTRLENSPPQHPQGGDLASGGMVAGGLVSDAIVAGGVPADDVLGHAPVVPAPSVIASATLPADQTGVDLAHLAVEGQDASDSTAVSALPAAIAGPSLLGPGHVTALASTQTLAGLHADGSIGTTPLTPGVRSALAQHSDSAAPLGPVTGAPSDLVATTTVTTPNETARPGRAPQAPDWWTSLFAQTAHDPHARATTWPGGSAPDPARNPGTGATGGDVAEHGEDSPRGAEDTRGSRDEKGPGRVDADRAAADRADADRADAGRNAEPKQRERDQDRHREPSSDDVARALEEAADRAGRALRTFFGIEEKAGPADKTTGDTDTKKGSGARPTPAGSDGREKRSGRTGSGPSDGAKTGATKKSDGGGATTAANTKHTSGTSLLALLSGGDDEKADEPTTRSTRRVLDLPTIAAPKTRFPSEPGAGRPSADADAGRATPSRQRAASPDSEEAARTTSPAPAERTPAASASPSPAATGSPQTHSGPAATGTATPPAPTLPSDGTTTPAPVRSSQDSAGIPGLHTPRPERSLVPAPLPPRSYTPVPSAAADPGGAPSTAPSRRPATPAARSWPSGVVEGDGPVASERGRPADVVVVGVDGRSWGAITSLAALDPVRDSPARLVLETPMLPDTGFDLSACAAGEYRAQWTAFGQRLAGVKNDPIVALGPGMNESGHPWSGDPATYAACFTDVARTVTAVAPDVAFQWTPALGSRPGMPGESVVAAWPKGDVVDLIGVDARADGRPWQEQVNGAYGLNYWAGFADRQGKRIAVARWGVLPHTRQDRSVNPAYVRNMHDWVARVAAKEALAYEAYSEPADVPEEIAAAYRALF